MCLGCSFLPIFLEGALFAHKVAKKRKAIAIDIKNTIYLLRVLCLLIDFLK